MPLLPPYGQFRQFHIPELLCGGKMITTKSPLALKRGEKVGRYRTVKKKNVYGIDRKGTS